MDVVTAEAAFDVFGADGIQQEQLFVLGKHVAQSAVDFVRPEEMLHHEAPVLEEHVRLVLPAKRGFRGGAKASGTRSPDALRIFCSRSRPLAPSAVCYFHPGVHGST